jgi:enoyl-CoA hydratase/carnithine racemase
MTEPIRLKKGEGIVEVLLNRPEAFNAFDLNMIGRNVPRPAIAGSRGTI